MQFPYSKFEGSAGLVYRPCLPITFGYKQKQFPVGSALVDTGSDFTILPLEIAHFLDIELDDAKRVRVACAGGGMFVALPSQKKVSYSIDRVGFRSIRWNGIVYFTEDEPLILLGHHECLEKLDLTFQGPERQLSVLPRF